MLLGKTDKARAALQARSPALNAMDRRLLILSDGERSRDSLLAMFGADVGTSIDRLVREGYLSARPKPGAIAQAASSIAAMLRPAPTAAPATPAIAPPPAAELSAKPAPSRRSLAAAKMYVVDMLQLQRNEASASLRAAIHTAPSEEELVYQLCKALLQLRASTTASYGERVTTRLAEILPEAWLPRLQAAIAAENGATPDAASSAA